MSETRLKYLEQVVNKLLINKTATMSTKNRNSKGGASNTGASTTPENINDDQIINDTPATPATHRLKYKGLDVKYQGKIVSITSADLSADPALLAFMIEKHPDELVEL